MKGNDCVWRQVSGSDDLGDKVEWTYKGPRWYYLKHRLTGQLVKVPRSQELDIAFALIARDAGDVHGWEQFDKAAESIEGADK